MKQKYIFLIIIFIVFIYSCDYYGSRKKPVNKQGEEWIINEDGDSVLNRYKKDGSLLSFTTYKNRLKNGLAVKYYKNGKVQFKIMYKDGYKDGEVIWYYDNGNIYRISNYVRGKIEGVQKKYYESGNLMAEIPYQNGEVQIGLKEYTKDGKLKKIYPTIKYELIDKLAFENKYILRLYLSNKSKAVKYYKYYKFPEQNTSWKEKIKSKDGVGNLVYNIYKGDYIMKKEIIRAEYKTSLGNIYVIEKTINVAADNKRF